MLNKLMGINFQETKKNSIEILYRLQKNVHESLYGMNNIDIPDKDKLNNQLNNISILDLLKLVYIKLVFGVTYKCQTYCMSNADKLARKKYLKISKNYKKVMSSKKLLAMNETEINELANNLKIVMAQSFGPSILFNNGIPYIINNKIRYNLWDKISLLNKDGTNKILGNLVISSYHSWFNANINDITPTADKNIIDDTTDTSVSNSKEQSKDIPSEETIYQGWKRFV